MTPDSPPRLSGVPALLQAILDTGEALRAALAEGDFDASARLAGERAALVAQLGAPHAEGPPPVSLLPLTVRIAAQHAALADAAREAGERLQAEREQVGRVHRAAGQYAAAPAAAPRLDTAG